MSQRLKLNQLEHFRAAGRFQHVTRAAEHLGVSQPALSRAIAALETGLGIALFEHSGRAIRLTQNGEILLRSVERGFAAIEEGLVEIRESATTASAGISIGFLRTLGYNFIPKLVRRFKAKHPDVPITLYQNNSTGLEEGMRQSQLDFAFIPRIEDAARFSWIKLAAQELLLVVPTAHRLAHRRTVSLSEVRNEPFVCFKSGHAFRELVDRLFRTAGFSPAISLECDDGSYLMGFVAAGLGIAVFPPDYVRVPNVKALRIAEPKAKREVGLAWPNDRPLGPAALTFLSFAKSAIRPDLTLR
ncbi:MAG TPA: LysR family transcriptional regulator [Stellaceae bacterium]|jgi:DNA-binding transcriptional LysR family regulator|nr:LysR family transcriptional regulator [Stellaceae bacterium]